MKFSGQNDDFTQLQQLALITFMRQEVCEGIQKNTLDITALVRQTNLLTLISQILGINSDQIFRYFKLEATWILSNLSFGNSEDIEYMLSEQFGIIDHINKALLDHDFQMIDQILWILANSAAESANLKNLILTKTHVIDSLTRLIVNTQVK